MSSLDQFIVAYPSPDDDNFGDIMGVKEEFRSLLYDRNTGEDIANEPNQDDDFFRNYQILIGRWMAPWTNNRALLIRWDPGVGKTRASLAFAFMWMRHTKHDKALFLSHSRYIHKALDDEVARYWRYDREINKITQNTMVRKQGFTRSTIVQFINSELKILLGLENRNVGEGSSRARTDYRGLLNSDNNRMKLRYHLRKKYKGYIILVDEVHILKPSDKDKMSYDYLIFFLDSIRDLCPIVILTATPVTNSWKDAFGIIGMLYPEEPRNYLMSAVEGLPDVITRGNTDIDERVDMAIDRLMEFSRGKVSSRSSAGVVPSRDYLPPQGLDITGRYNIVVDDNNVAIDHIYPVIMSEYQSTILAGQIGGEDIRSLDMESNLEDSEISDSLYTRQRLMYDIVGPVIYTDTGNKYIDPQDLIVEDNGKYLPSSEAEMVYASEDGEVETENVFKIYYTIDNNGNEVMDQTKGLAKYSIKYATLIHILTRDPNLIDTFGYVHTLWVKNGVRLIAAALAANGWEQYTDTNVTSTSDIPRFGIISGDTTSKANNKLIEIANSERNRKGKVVRIILGSKKSGISVSFTNARFFIELSPDFNKATEIQAEGRVLRADSLTWAEEEGIPRGVYIIRMIALPYGSDRLDTIRNGIIKDENYTIDMDTDEIIEEFDDHADNLKAEVLQSITNEDREEYPPNTSDEYIASSIMERRYVHYNPSTIEVKMYYLSENKYVLSQMALDALHASSIESIIESHLDDRSDTINDALLYGSDVRHSRKVSMLRGITRYGASRISINDMYGMKGLAELVSSHTLAMTRYGIPRPIQPVSDIVTAYTPSGGDDNLFNMIYDTSFFITSEDRSYDIDAINARIDTINSLPMDEYQFYTLLCRSSMADVKIAALELSLSMPAEVKRSKIAIFNEKRSMILSMYDGFWNTYIGGTIAHIATYAIKKNSYNINIGIDSKPDMKTRIISYNTGSHTSKDHWGYVTSRSSETIYLSPMSTAIKNKELDVADNEYGYYVHLSIFDGQLRIRSSDIEAGIRPRTIDIVINSEPSIIGSMLGISGEEASHAYSSNKDALLKDLYYVAKDQNILMIR